MELNSNEMAQIIYMLEHADGEDLQFILNQLGMEGQLCRQLIKTQPLYIVSDTYAERLDLEMNLKTNQHGK